MTDPSRVPPALAHAAPLSDPFAEPAGEEASHGPASPRSPVWNFAVGGVLFFSFFLGLRIAFPDPKYPDVTLVQLTELALRHTATWLGLVAATRYLARRITGDGWRTVWVVLGWGALVAAAAVAFLNLVPCVLPGYGCPRINGSWLLMRTLATVGWWEASVGLLVAWIAAVRAGSFLEQEIRGQEVRRELSRLQVSTLTMQLRPHFLFNTLQSVATLMHRDLGAARQMLAGLRELFHRSVNLLEQTTVPLDEELATIHLYTRIESTRFGDRLRFTVDADADARRASVPPFLLQPLVENSIHHAVGMAGEGEVVVTARVDEDRRWLLIDVSDTGPGTDRTRVRGGFGLGIANTRGRLESLYRTDYELTLTQTEKGGGRVRVRLPYRPFEPETPGTVGRG